MDDYKSAALRHFSDVAVLAEAGRTDNAAHLIGFAAECAIKYRITSLRPGQESPHGHFPDILIAARKHLKTRTEYMGMYNILKGDIFGDWNVNNRYAKTGHTQSEDLKKWVNVTRRLFATARLKAEA